MGENSQSSVEEVISIDDGFTIGTGATGTTASGIGSIGGTVSQDAPTSNAGSATTPSTTIAFSKKAIHQRDADENLFLRFLELDPVIEPPVAGGAAAPNTATATTSTTTSNTTTEKPSSSGASTSGSNRRQSSIKHNAGRTPFTITKRLVRTNDKGFGFSIVWTHPPRVEKVEAGLSADRSGIVPGDYVIFVDKHNVVTMPEMDILNLIRSQGNILLLEIFRRPNSSRANGIKTSSLRVVSHVSSNEDINLVPSSLQISSQVTAKTIVPTTPAMMAPRSSTACSNASVSVETTSKRRLHLPQVTFSKEVGRGVIV